MAGSAWIGDAGLVSLRGRNESECVSAHEIVLDGLLDLGHVAGNALAAGAVFRVMRMLAHCAF